MARNSHHVVPSKDGRWSVKKSGAIRATRNFDRKDDAVNYGRGVSKNVGSELYIHKRDGTIQKKDSHSNDPCPPKGKK